MKLFPENGIGWLIPMTFIGMVVGAIPQVNISSKGPSMPDPGFVLLGAIIGAGIGVLIECVRRRQSQ